ncbi:MAG: hypothetical protein AB7V77_04575 [Candidatus Woesearchaeota archaeon]
MVEKLKKSKIKSKKKTTNNTKKNEFENNLKKITKQPVKLFEKINNFRKNNVLFFIIICVVIALFLAFLIFSITNNIKFMLKDDLQISINPLQIVINTNKQNTTQNFEISLTKFNFCNSNCELKIKDTYLDSYVYNESFSTKSKQLINKNLTFKKTADKFGQQIYYVEITCKNEKSFLCKTQSLEKYRSSLVSINYEYDKKTRTNLIELQNNLISKYNEIKNFLNNELEINNLINSINSTINTNKQLTTKSKNYFVQLNESLNLYYEQEFEISINKLNFIVENNELELINLRNDILIFNNNINLLNNFYSNKYNEMYSFYYLFNQTIKESIEEIYSYLNSIPKNNFENLIIFNLTPTNNKLNEIELQYKQDKQIEDTKYEVYLNDSFNLLNKLYNLQYISPVCELANLIEIEIEKHNEGIESTDNYQTELNFIKENIYDVEINSTHLISGTNSIINTNLLSLQEYFKYIEIPQINTNYCNNNLELFNVTQLNNISKTNIILFNESLKLEYPNKYTCIFNNCTEQKNKNPQPIIFIHGHSFNQEDPVEYSISIFNNVRRKLSDENLIINGGDIDYTSSGNDVWVNSNIPIGISASYFYIKYYDLDLISTSIQKDEGIEIYSLRLKDLIDTTLTKTNSNKVILVTHSMGGLVARNYLSLFGEGKVDKVIFIAPPNHGVNGKVNTFCSWFGAKKTCEDLSENSIFLKRLDDYDISIPVYNIIGQGCDTNGLDGDGIVSVNSAKLDFANNIYINGTCNDFLGVDFHMNIVNSDETYNLVKEILFENIS